ncbi:MAG TPA: hypothetical protein VGJ40_07965 [Gaiellaceae bacterium]|jgi:hypothetical protein
MRLTGRLVVVLVAVTLALAASGCGGNKSYSGTKPSIWTAHTCGALTTWRDSLVASSQRLNVNLRNVRDLKAVKARVLVFLENAERSTSTLIDQVKSTGAPAVKDGAEIQHDLERGLIRARSSFTRAIARAKQLPTDDSQAFSGALTTLGEGIRKELTTTGTYFSNLSDKYDSKELRDAVSKEPACQSISSTS